MKTDKIVKKLEDSLLKLDAKICELETEKGRIEDVIKSLKVLIQEPLTRVVAQSIDKIVIPLTKERERKQ